jgi:hypothetical protein
MEVLGTVGVIEHLTRLGKQRLDVFPDPLGPITDDAQAHLLFRNSDTLLRIIEESPVGRQNHQMLPILNICSHCACSMAVSLIRRIASPLS